MEVISSRQNPNFKHVAKLLSSAKYRKEHGLAAAEGIHLAVSLLQSELVIKQLVVAESALQNPEIISLVSTAHSSVVIKDSLFSAISDISASTGAITVFDIPTAQPPKVLSADAILLEDIQDPGNVGAILRTAAAAGVGQVYLSPGCALAWSPKVLRAGMGAQFGLQIYEAANLADVIKASTVNVLATSLQGVESLYSQDLRTPNAWLFGNEGQGVSAELQSLVSKKVIIPQANTAVESLNVAAAAAVCLYEQLRQRA